MPHQVAAVARRLSEGPNASRGGVVGVVAPGDLFDRGLDVEEVAGAVGRRNIDGIRVGSGIQG